MFEDSSDESDDEAMRKKEETKQFVRGDVDIDDEEFYYKSMAGEILAEDFKVIEDLGKGVYGSVIKAQQMSTGKLVAIKVQTSFNFIDSQKC